MPVSFSSPIPYGVHGKSFCSGLPGGVVLGLLRDRWETVKLQQMGMSVSMSVNVGWSSEETMLLQGFAERAGLLGECESIFDEAVGGLFFFMGAWSTDIVAG